jgi:hypothetical protein
LTSGVIEFQVPGFWFQVAGCRLQVAGCRLLVAGCRFRVSCPEFKFEDPSLKKAQQKILADEPGITRPCRDGRATKATYLNYRRKNKNKQH